jgi:hypothetical protein
MNEALDFDHTVLAELISRRWQEDRPYFALNRIVRGAWHLERRVSALEPTAAGVTTPKAFAAAMPGLP